MPRYMDDWNDEFEYELMRAEREAEENGEEFDEDEWRKDRLRTPASEINEAIDDEIDEFLEEQDDFDEGAGETEPGNEEQEDGHEDDLSEESSDGQNQGTDKKVREYPEDPWAEDEHRQRNRKGGGGHNSNNGLRQAERNAGDFYDYAYMEPEDGHGISVPQLTAFDKDDDEKVFRKPETPEERHSAKMDRVARKYERNDDPDDGFGSDDNDNTVFDDWVESKILSSREEREEDNEPEADDRLTHYEDDIMAKAEERVIEFFADGKEEEHYRRLRDDTRYLSSADRELYSLYRELDHKLEFYEDRISESPHDKDLYLPHVHGALEAIDNAQHLYAKNRERHEELKEKKESGELSEMQYQDQSIALDYNLQRRLTNNQYAAISGGSSMFGDIGKIMDRWNNLVDDTLSEEPDKLQDARDFIGQLPREIADQLVEEAVEEGMLNQSQASHLMTMSARPTNSLSHTPQPQKKGFGAKAKRFLGL